MKKISNTEAELKKSVAYEKKACDTCFMAFQKELHRKKNYCM